MLAAVASASAPAGLAQGYLAAAMQIVRYRAEPTPVLSGRGGEALGPDFLGQVCATEFALRSGPKRPGGGAISDFPFPEFQFERL